MRRDTKHLSVFNLNVGKYGPEIIPYLDTFQQRNALKATLSNTLKVTLPSLNIEYYWMEIERGL